MELKQYQIVGWASSPPANRQVCKNRNDLSKPCGFVVGKDAHPTTEQMIIL